MTKSYLWVSLMVVIFWRANLNQVLDVVEPLKAKLGDRLWIAPSCSLLHSPYDLEVETQLQANKPELYNGWLSQLQKNSRITCY